MKEIQIASTIGLSAIKHTFGGLPMAAGFGFSYLEVAAFTAIGGIIGVAAFLFLAESIKAFSNRYFPSKKAKRIFTKKNRFIVKVKQRFGLAGIAFLTPSILSVPIGTMVAASIFRDRKKVFLYLSMAVLIWSFGGAALLHPLAQWLGA